MKHFPSIILKKLLDVDLSEPLLKEEHAARKFKKKGCSYAQTACFYIFTAEIQEINTLIKSTLPYMVTDHDEAVAVGGKAVPILGAVERAR